MPETSDRTVSPKAIYPSCSLQPVFWISVQAMSAPPSNTVGARPVPAGPRPRAAPPQSAWQKSAMQIGKSLAMFIAVQGGEHILHVDLCTDMLSK